MNHEEIFNSLCEFAQKTFDQEGSVSPLFMAVSENNESYVFVTPFGNDDEKNLILTRLRMFFKEKNIVRYGFIMEAWSATTTGDPSVDRLAPSQRSDRNEILGVCVIDPEFDILNKMWTINRDFDGKTSLSEISCDSLSSSGLFLSLLG